MSYTFSKESFSYILEKENAKKKKKKKNAYILGNGTLLYFSKQKLLKTSYISGSNFPSLKNKKSLS